MSTSVFKSRSYWAVVAALLAGLAAWFFHRAPGRFFADEGVVWTTGYHITYQSPRSLSDSIRAVLDRVDASASVYNERSLVSRLNRNETDRVDSLIERMYYGAWMIYWQSGGAYDPTVMPLVNAWGFGYKTGALPDDRQLDSILDFVGMKRTRLAEGRLHKDDPRTQLDFSSIAKGLAVDEVGRMMERNGVDNYLVEIGGEVRARGTNARGDVWHVSVDMPGDQRDTVDHTGVVVLAIDGLSVATSGSYRKYREQGGQRVSHIVDPRTGQSRVSDLLSVTVVADDCMTADAWATACMAMGTDRTQALMRDIDNLGVMTINADSAGNLVVWSNHRFASLIP